jgi:hypothetical protein
MATAPAAAAPTKTRQEAADFRQRLTVVSLFQDLFGGGSARPTPTPKEYLGKRHPPEVLLLVTQEDIGPNQRNMERLPGQSDPDHNPDYYTVFGGTGGVVGLTRAVTIDRNGHMYLSGGYYIGIPTGPAYGATVGYVERPSNPNEAQIQQFLNGPSQSVTLGSVIGGGVTWNQSGLGVSEGFMSPQIGYSKTLTREIH